MSDKKKNLKYTSIIPKPPHTLSAYQLFTKSKFTEFNEHIPANEKISKVGEMWKLIPSSELEILKERSEILKNENKKLWNDSFHQREEQRREWCGKLGVSVTTAWEELDRINRTQWEQKNGSLLAQNSKEKKGVSNQKKTKKSSKEEESSSSDDEEGGESSKRKNSSSNGKSVKKRRVAIEHALIKMKESAGLEEIADSESDDSDSNSKKKKVLKAHQASSGTGTGMLSGSYMSGGGGAGGRSANNEGSGDKKKLKKRTSRLGDVEWASATWGEERVKAVIKGIDKVYEMALDQNNFDIFGNDMIQCFYDVATVTGEPIRSKTLKYVEHLANRWKYTIMQDGWKEKTLPTPCEVIEVVTGMYCMERVGIRHDLKAEVLQFLDSPKAYSAKDYFGWDPVNEPLSAEGGMEVISDCHVSKYRLMSSSLIHSFYSDRVGLRLGCEYADIFKWLPLLRPYKGPHELSWQEYIDQCYLITHIIFTTNNWGELSLEPALFPHEYLFLRNHLEIHIQQRDVHLISEFVESLRCFGCNDEDPLIRKGIRTLLGLQTENGIWDPTDDEPYRTYHATMCASQALLAHRFRGYGPGIPSVLPLLIQWSNETIDKSEEYRSLARECHSQILVTAEKVIKYRELEYGPIVSGDIATEGSITKPKDIAAHSAERMNSLKMAMRSFAKATSHLFTLLPSAEVSSSLPATDPTAAATSPAYKSRFGPATPSPAAPSGSGEGREEDSGMIDEANGIVLDKLFQTIARYLQSISNDQPPASPSAGGANGKTPKGKQFSEDEITNFVNQLTVATKVPVTTTILQANRYKNLTKHLRALSKGKTKDGKTIDATVQVASSKLMTIWKNRVLSNATATAGESENGLNSPRASSDLSLPSPLEIRREESAESIPELPVDSATSSDAPSDSPRGTESPPSQPSSEMEVVKSEESPIEESSGSGGEAGLALATEHEQLSSSSSMEIAG